MARLTLKYRNTGVSSTALLVAAGNFDIIGWNLINTGASNAFLKFYNSATAAGVTVGTTTPVKTLLIPAGGTFMLSNEEKLQDGYNNGIVIAATSGLADSDTGVPTTSVYVELNYQASQ